MEPIENTTKMKDAEDLEEGLLHSSTRVSPSNIDSVAHHCPNAVMPFLPIESDAS